MRKYSCSLVLFAGCLCLATSVLGQWIEYPPGSFAERYLEARLEIGFRITHFNFADPERETIDEFGTPTGGYTDDISTYSMHPIQNYRPSPYVRYYFNRHVGLQLAWEYLEGRTRTRDVMTREGYDHSNGNPRLRGPSVMLLGRYPLDEFEYPVRMITPYAGVGWVMFSGSFKHDPDWHANGRRNMAVDDTVGALLTLGTTIEIYAHWMVDLEMNFVRARPDARYWMRGDRNPRAEWTFPMDSWMFQAGVKYVF